MNESEVKKTIPIYMKIGTHRVFRDVARISDRKQGEMVEVLFTALLERLSSSTVGIRKGPEEFNHIVDEIRKGQRHTDQPQRTS